MTGYTVHTGSNDKFRSGWDNIFKSKKKTESPAKLSKSKKVQKAKKK